MGIGLSPLQKSILQLAFKVSPKRGMRKDDVLEKVWRWKPAPPEHRVRCNRTTKYSSSTYYKPLGWRERFASELVGGKKKYQSIHASTSRSIRRLKERGLIEWKWGRYSKKTRWPHPFCGYQLTPKGKKVWQELEEKEK